MLKKECTYSYKDVAIVPAKWTNIDHRSDCKVEDENGNLPIFTAPMSSVVNSKNYRKFENVGIIPILPRSEPISVRLTYATQCEKWAAFSLEEVITHFLNNKELAENLSQLHRQARVLIDVANGHMLKLFSLCQKLRKKYKNRMLIMIGNIANPQTFLECVDAGVDYVRCSIGTGDGCTTTTKTGIHYGIASLIDEIAKIKNSYHGNKKVPKIIADGGIRDYDDVIKALALGADYVMIGGLFATCRESCGDKYRKLPDGSFYLLNKEEKEEWFASQSLTYTYFNTDEKSFYECPIYTEFYGMASESGQKAISGKVTKHSEGIEKMKLVDKCLSSWVSELRSSLASAMSYCNSKTLKDFIYNQELKLVSPHTYNSVNRFN